MKNKHKSFIRWIVIRIVVLAAIIAGVYAAYAWHTAQVEQRAIVVARGYEEKIQVLAGEHEKLVRRMKDEVLDRLHAGESNYHPKAGELFYTNDPYNRIKDSCSRIGGKRHVDCDSWGPYQFKITTIQHYIKKIEGKDISQVDAMFIALDEKKARAMAEAIIFEEVGGIWNWSAAQRDSSFFAQQIPFIRTLENK